MRALASAILFFLVLTILTGCGLSAEDLIAQALVPERSVTVVIQNTEDGGVADAGVADAGVADAEGYDSGEFDADEAEEGSELPDEIRLVVTTGDPAASYLVLPLEVGEEPLLDAEFIGTFSVRSPIADPSSEVRGWQGRGVTVFDAHGESCEAETGGAYALSLVTPHFGTLDHWVHEKGGLEGTALAEAQTSFAASLQEMAYGSSMTVRLKISEECEISRPVWGRPSAGSAVPIGEVELTEAEEGELVAAFQALPTFQEAQAEFASTPAGRSGELWISHEGHLRIEAYAGGDGTVAVVTAYAGEVCSSFFAHLSAVFVRDEDGWTPVVESIPASPVTLIDSGGDLPSIVGIEPVDGWPRMLTVDSRGGYEILGEVESTFYDCRC